VQIIAFEHPTHLSEARADGRTGGWSALRNLSGTYARVSDAVRGGLEELVLADNSAAADRWAKWQSRTRYPKDLDPDEPALLVWEPELSGGRSRDHEVFLQRRIAKHLRKRGWRDHDEARDGFSLPTSNLLRLDDESRGFPDIVLVDESRPKSLVVIEVKKDAMPYPGLSGVDQLDDYGPAIRRLAPGWKIQRWLVARTVHPLVLKSATDRGIEAYVWHGRPARLKKL
jgi:hypothetical protein